MKHLRTLFLLAVCMMSLHAMSDDAVEINGIYYNLVSKAKQAEVTKNPSKYQGTIVIPASFVYEGVLYSVTSISNRAFSGCSGLTSVTVSNSITSIGAYAFYGCSGLTSITIPNSVKNIDNFAFQDCKGLTSVIIPNSVTNIGAMAFEDCISLTSIIIPNSVTIIAEGAFQGCKGLTSVSIPNSITSIDHGAFFECSGLTSVNIPNSVTSIGSYAFSNCSSLTSVTIPNSVTSIGSSAFQNCSSLTSVTIGNGIKYVYGKAFGNCSQLTDVYCYAESVPKTNSDVFEGSYIEYVTLHVPDESVQLYKNAVPWSQFGTIVSLSSTTVNQLTMSDLDGYTGNQVVLPIGLENEKSITGLQFDLYLPTGVTVAKKSNGKMIIETTDRMDGNYTISSNTIDNYVRIAGYSGDGDAFTGTEGDILNVTLNIGENVLDGDYTIRIKDIVLSDVNNTEYHPADVEATLTVKSYTLGDVDNSGAANINDVVCIINYILNKPNGTFIAEAADVDGSGSININDVVTLINRFILMKGSAPALLASALLREVSIADNYLHLADISIKPGETQEIQLLMTNANEVRGVQGNIKLPAGLSFVKKDNGKVDAKNINARSEDFTLSCAIQDNGSLTFTQYSADGFTYEGSSGGIFTFKIKADENATAGTYSVDLTGVVLSIDGVGYDIPDRTSNLTITGSDGISETLYDGGNEKWYTLDGKLLQGKPTQKGVYMLNGRKVVVK